METKVSLSQIGLYNPQRQSNELTEKLFVVHQKQFEFFIENLNNEATDSIPQHSLILAQRGMGKTTMLKRIEVELHKEQYRRKFIPLLFPEEQYGLKDLTKFWLNCLDALADSLDVEKYDENEIDKIDKHIKELMYSKKTNNLNEKLYRYLMLICNRLGRRPVLLVDNMGLVFNRLSKQEQHILRGYISEKSCPIIIGAGVAMAGCSDAKEYVIDYKAPFYDFFQIMYLKKMSMEEFLELIQNLSKITQANISITSAELPRLQSLIQLTGGNPRTSVMLFKLLVKGFSEEIVDDLEALLDEITPLYKARFEELPTQQQIILDAIAQNWNPMNLKRISEETRFENNQLSPQLKRLVEDGWLETTKAENAKGSAYSIPERFFCIYLIMRNGSRRSKKQIKYLSKFLECFYGKVYLSRVLKSFINQEKHKEAIEVYNKALSLDPKNAIAYRFLGNAYGDIAEYMKAIEYYNKSIEINPDNEVAYKQRGYNYSEIKESSKAIADYTKAIEINPNYVFAYNDRGWEYTYGKCQDYSKAVADYTKAIELDVDCNAKKHLMHLYRDIKKQFDKAKEIFNMFDIEKTPKEVYCLEQALFSLHERNEGIASNHLSEAFVEIEDKLNPKTQGSWEYFAAIVIKLGLAQWLLDIFSEKGFDIVLSPLFVAIQALNIERIKDSEAAEIYLKNQAVEKSEPARIIMKKMRKYI